MKLALYIQVLRIEFLKLIGPTMKPRNPDEILGKRFFSASVFRVYLLLRNIRLSGDFMGKSVWINEVLRGLHAVTISLVLGPSRDVLIQHVPLASFMIDSGEKFYVEKSRGISRSIHCT